MVFLFANITCVIIARLGRKEINMTIKEMLEERVAKGENKKKAQIEIGKKVKALLNSGYSNKEVADELGLSEAIVRKIREGHKKKA